jgi:hypothetical protein
MFFVAMMWMSLQKWFMFQLNINKDLTVLTVESGVWVSLGILSQVPIAP